MLKINNLNKTYQTKEQTVHAIKGLSLEFDSSGFVVILGKSGSGKSTLLNIIGGLDDFDDGEMIIKNKSTDDFNSDLWDSYRNTYVGIVFQEFYLVDEFSIGKNISLALELQGYKSDDINDSIKEILKKVDLDGYQDRKPNELSGGQKQRIAIARALIKDPQIILCDEPTGNLDSETSKIILESLKNLSKTKLVIMVTHDREFAHLYGNRIIELQDGQVVKDYFNQVNQVDETSTNELIKKVIRIPKGKKITQNMIHNINNLIMNSDKKLYLSVMNNNSNLNLYPTQVNENSNNIPIKKEMDDSFSLKKTKLPYNYAFKLAINSIFKKKIRLIFMLFLFVFSLIFTGVALNLSFYNPLKAASLTFQKVNLKIMPLTKEEKYCWGSDPDECSNYNVTFNEADIQHLQKTYEDINFITTYKSNISIKDLVPLDSIKYENGYYSSTFNRITILDENREAFKLRIGTYPIENEVAITDYMAEMFIVNQAFNDIGEMSDLVGKEITYDHKNVRISGISETNYQKHDALKECKISDCLPWRFYEDLVDYKILFMTDSTYDTTFYPIKTNFRIRNTSNTETFYQTVSSTIFNEDYNEELIGRLPENDDEIVLTLSTLKDKFLIDYENIESYLNNDLNLSYLIYNSPYDQTSEEFTYHLVGIIDDENTNIPFEMMLTKAEFLDKYYESVHLSETYVTALLSNDINKNTDFLKNLDTSPYKHNTKYSPDLDYLGRTVKEFKIVFYIIGLVFTIFASLLIFTFMSTSIKYKQKEIGTLRAIGARGKDVAKIFITEAIIISIFSSTLAGIGIYVALDFLNKQFTSGFHLDIVLLYQNIIGLIGVFLLSLVIIVISTFIPIKRITMMKPINAIKGLK